MEDFKYTDQKAMFEDIGPLNLRASIFPPESIGDIRYCTVEELYQHFKARLLEEVDFDSRAVVSGRSVSAKTPYPHLMAVIGIDFSAWPDVPKQSLFISWIKLRKIKNVAVTQEEMDLVNTEILLARTEGYTSEDCIKLAVAMGWAGFKWVWMRKEILNMPLDVICAIK